MPATLLVHILRVTHMSCSRAVLYQFCNNFAGQHIQPLADPFLQFQQIKGAKKLRSRPTFPCIMCPPWPNSKSVG